MMSMDALWMMNMCHYEIRWGFLCYKDPYIIFEDDKGGVISTLLFFLGMLK